MSEKLKILVIDDEEDFCFFVRENLIREGTFDVFVATTGVYGIALAVKEQPDIILLDLVMPDMPGEDVADELKKKPATSNIPILFITALATEDDIENSNGSNYMLAKPVRTKKLIETVHHILGICAFNHHA